MPALLLAYSLIDISGWLNSDEKRVKVRFTDWVEKYMLPSSNLRCSSLELYAARCGLLHSYSASSNVKNVRKIFYTWLPTRVEDHEKLISLYEEMTVRLGNTPEKLVAIQAEDIFAALRIGVDKFLSDIANDPQRAEGVYAKTENVMVENQEIDMHSLIAAAKEVRSLCGASRSWRGRSSILSSRHCARTRDKLPIRLPTLAECDRAAVAQVHSASCQVRDGQDTGAQAHASEW